MGFLRRHLHRPDPRQHQGDHHRRRSARAPHHAGVSRVRAGAAVSHRCGARAAAQDKGRVERAVPSVRDDCFAGEVLTTLDDARALALRRGVSTTMACAGTVARNGARSSTFAPRSSPCCCPRRPRRTTSRCWSEPKVARDQLAVGRQGDSIRFRIPTSARLTRPRRRAHRPLLCPRPADQDPSPASRRAASRSRRSDYPVERSVYALRNVAALQRQADAGRPGHRALRRRAARQPVAVDAHAPRVCAARSRPPLRRRARDRGLHRRARRRHARCPAAASHARTGGGTAPPATPPARVDPARPLSPPRAPSMRCRSARPSEGEES